MTTPPEAPAGFAREIELYLRSRFTVIGVVTFEEESVVRELKALCERSKRHLILWDHADFFQPQTAGAPEPPAAKDALTVLDAVEKMSGDLVFVLRDFHQCWCNQPRVVRKLRNVAQKLKYTRKTVVFTTPQGAIPDELKDDIVLIERPAPEMGELREILKALAATPGVKVNLTPEGEDRLLRAALGLSSNQARRVFAKAVVRDGVLDERDIDLVALEKKQIVKESGALQFFTASETIADVGGLEVLKEWVRIRESAFTRAAEDYGLPAPKGIALIGIPGTGKSLSAKAIAGMWRLPLIRLDMGALFGSLVGQSEANTRRALLLAETVAPCLLWIDEIEKGLASGGGDGGTSMRVFGSILSWMQEKTRPVFIVATANNISALPPELLRRGRFDEIFFLDLPTGVERREILQVHLQKRKRPVQGYDLDKLAAACEGFVGAEIEQAIVDAMYLAFADARSPGRDFTTEDVLAAMARLVPMSRSQRESIAALRQWLNDGRAQSASFRERTAAQEHFVPLEIGQG